jgi:autotransporter-associated beta strand protein
MKKRGRKILSFAAVAVVIAALAGVAWAGILGGQLNSDNIDVDLSVATSYAGGSATNPVTLGNNLSVNLTQNLILGDSSVTGYAADPLYLATDNAAGGAIYLGAGQTLNIRPEAGKRVNGKTSATSSLRLYGSGTTNLGGSGNSYSVTFLQSGRLNVESKEALGGSTVTLAGGSSLGLTNSQGNLDLAGVTLNVMRFDPIGVSEPNVTFDTGTREADSIKIDGLAQPTKYNLAQADDITLIKTGAGTLTISGVTDHSGGTRIDSGTLELGAAPRRTQNIEINSDAALSSNVKLLTNVTIKPHSGSYLTVPAIRTEAATQADSSGEAALLLANVDASALRSFPFTVKANLEGLRKPAGAEADRYYVKLLNSPVHGLSTNDVSVEAVVPTSFSTYFYAVRTYVDNDNVYALLSRDLTVYSNIFDVNVYNDSTSNSIVNVVVGNSSEEPFTTGASFKYRFVDTVSGYIDLDSGAVTGATVFTAKNVEFNQGRTKARFQIDLNNLVGDDGRSYVLTPGRSYEIRVDGDGDASGSTGTSTVLVDHNGRILPPGPGAYSVDIDVRSVDVTLGTIEPRVHILVNNQPPVDGTIVYFNLCDTFGDPVKISGVQTERPAYAEIGYAAVKFEQIPSGRYLIRVTSPQFSTVKFSDVIQISRGGGGGGGGCDAGFGVFALLALGGALVIRRRG